MSTAPAEATAPPPDTAQLGMWIFLATELLVFGGLVAAYAWGRTRWPDGFAVHPKLERQLLARPGMFERDEIDWALGEALAFGSLLLAEHRGIPGEPKKTGYSLDLLGRIGDQVFIFEFTDVPIKPLAINRRCRCTDWCASRRGRRGTRRGTARR